MRKKNAPDALPASTELFLDNIPVTWKHLWRTAKECVASGNLKDARDSLVSLAVEIHPVIDSHNRKQVMLAPDHEQWILSLLQEGEWFYFFLCEDASYTKHVKLLDEAFIRFYSNTFAKKQAAHLVSIGYSYKHTIGHGTFGSVTKHIASNNEVVAVKAVRFPKIKSMRTANAHECQIGQLRPSHPNLVGHIKIDWFYFFGVTFPIMGMPFVSDTLRSALMNDDFLRRDALGLAKDAFVRDLAEGLKAMHNAEIYHGDISPDNVLAKYCPKLSRWVLQYADFGTSRHFSDPLLPCAIQHGHIEYEDKAMCQNFLDDVPLILYSPSAFAKDSYAVGMLIHMILTGITIWELVPFTRDDLTNSEKNREIAQYINQGKLTLSINKCGIFGNVITHLTDEDPLKRPSAKQLCDAVAGARFNVV